MKIKHWAGYGTVNAKKFFEESYGSTHYVTVGITGDHECGLDRPFYDPYCIEKWLKRFLKGGKLITYNVIDHGYIRIDNKNTEHIVIQLVFDQKAA